MGRCKAPLRGYEQDSGPRWQVGQRHRFLSTWTYSLGSSQHDSRLPSNQARRENEEEGAGRKSSSNCDLMWRSHPITFAMFCLLKVCHRSRLYPNAKNSHAYEYQEVGTAEASLEASYHQIHLSRVSLPHT